MHALYDAHKVDRAFYPRIKLIRNYVTLPAEREAMPIDRVPQLCYIGRGTAEKRVFLAAAIAERVAQYIAGTTIQMIGDVKAAVPAQLQTYCRFEGMIRKEEMIYTNLRKADFLLLTSSREGLPMVMMEAMACGVIPIVTAVGDIPNIIEHGKNGYLLPVENEQAIIEEAAQIICDLSQDPQKTLRIKKQAYHDCERLFSQAQFETEWTNTLRSRKK
jgi:glycosyltransferase involved in cell wall biosynthesis